MKEFNPPLMKIIATIYGRNDASWEELYDASKEFIWKSTPDEKNDVAILAMRLMWHIDNIVGILRNPDGGGMLLINNLHAMKDIVADYIYRGKARDIGLTTEMLSQADIPLRRTELI